MATINSLPPEILILILKFSSSRKLFRSNFINWNIRKKDYFESNKTLTHCSLVDKSWKDIAQSVLLRSVILWPASKGKCLSFLDFAPIDCFNVQELVIRAYNQDESLIRNILSKVKGLVSLQISTIKKEIDVSVFLSSGLLKSLITPKLTKLSITHTQIQDQHFLEGFKLAAPNLKELQLDIEAERDLEIYLPLLPLCTSVIHFSTNFDKSDKSFIKSLVCLVETFKLNQVLHLTLQLYRFNFLEHILFLLAQPSIKGLKTLNLLGSKGYLNSSTISNFSMECSKRGITLNIEE